MQTGMLELCSVGDHPYQGWNPSHPHLPLPGGSCSTSTGRYRHCEGSFVPKSEQEVRLLYKETLQAAWPHTMQLGGCGALRDVGHPCILPANGQRFGRGVPELPGVVMHASGCRAATVLIVFPIRTKGKSCCRPLLNSIWEVTQHQHNSNPRGDSQPQNQSLGRGWALPHELGRPLMRVWGLQPTQVSHTPDIEEQHLSDAQQTGGNGEGEEGDAEEDMMGFVTAAQREGRTRHQEEATAQEPLQVIGASEGAQPCRQPTHISPWAASTHLQEVEHKGSHPAPAVQAVHVGDALVTV